MARAIGNIGVAGLAAAILLGTAAAQAATLTFCNNTRDTLLDPLIHNVAGGYDATPGSPGPVKSGACVTWNNVPIGTYDIGYYQQGAASGLMCSYPVKIIGALTVTLTPNSRPTCLR